jgi:hypothetical protein
MFVPVEVVTFFAGVIVGIIGNLIFKDIFDDPDY